MALLPSSNPVKRLLQNIADMNEHGRLIDDINREIGSGEGSKPNGDGSRGTSSILDLQVPSYVTLATSSDLDNERVLTAGEAIDLTDAGAGSTITVACEDASTSNKGVLETATKAETIAQSATDKALTPSNIPSIPDHHNLNTFIQSNTRFQAINIWGDLLKIVDAGALDSGTSVNLTNGISKLVISVNAGGDLVGNITVNGTSVNRDTGATTGADSETIVIDGATTDNTGTDSGGYTQWDFTDAYITSKWWTGAITLDYDGGAPLAITDLDVYQCSFHQFNDEANIRVDGFDINAMATNASAALFAHLYSVKPTAGSKVDIVSEVDIELPAASVAAGVYYRLRRGTGGGLPLDIDGTSEGVFCNMNLERDATEGDWIDMSIYLHFIRQEL